MSLHTVNFLIAELQVIISKEPDNEDGGYPADEERERERASKAVFIEGSIDLELAPLCWLLAGGGTEGRGWL